MKTKEEFNEYMEKFNYKIKPNQYEFYARTFDFMKSNKKFLINPAGMALGKTHPTTTIINNFSNKYDIIFVANPTSPLKYIWVKNLLSVRLLNQTAIWPSKRDVCIYKQLFKDKKFPLSNCKDDCIYQTRCKSHDTYTDECREDYEKYMDLGEKATPLNYYDKLIKEKKIDLNDYIKNKKTFPFNCLYAPTRMGLRDLYKPGTRKIIVGDYNGFLMPEIFKLVTKEDPSRLDSLLIIDEGHLINARARNRYSNTVYLNRNINGLEHEFNKYQEKLKPSSQGKISFFIEQLKKLIPKLEKKVEKGKLNYTYTNLREDFLNDNKFIEIIINELNILNDIINKDKDKEGQMSSALIFASYFFSLINYSHKPEYYCSLEKSTYYQKIDLRLDCMCVDPSKHLKKIFKDWDKIIINTGTLHKNKKIVLGEIGINKEDCIYEKFLKSYDLSDYVFILPEGKFNSTYRNITYNSNIKNLSEVLSRMSGKTLIFIQSKSDSLLLEKLLKQNKFSVINFCENEDNEEEISPEEFEKLKNEFVNYDKKCIGIININGRVEGHNFTDDDSIPQVKNVIIYGFPLPYVDDLIKAREKLYIKKLLGETEDEILNHIYLTEPIQKIQQACYRCKRESKQNPIIILWGERFTTFKIYIYKKEDKSWRIIEKENNIFNSLPEDFKNNIGNYNKLIEFIKKRENDQTNNIH